MNLLADRFWLQDSRVIDLASGSEVTLVTSSVGGPSDQQRWLTRCDRLATLHQPDLARLIDFGWVGESGRFEAWRAAAVWPGTRPNDVEIRLRANAFLTAAGVQPTREARVLSDGGRLIVVPDDAAGYPVCDGQAGRVTGALALESCGIDDIARPAIAAIAEVLADSGRVEPCAIALWGEPGSGLRHATSLIARTARLHGMVPVHVSIEEPAVWEALTDRSVLIVDPVGDGRGWRRLVSAGLRAVRSHLLLLTSREETRHVHNVRLGRVAGEQLIQSVMPADAAAPHAEAIARAAASAQGRPGLFARQLWSPALGWGSARLRSRAAEPRARYVASQGPERAPGGPRPWPVSGDVGALRREVTHALDALRRGRIAAADRNLRAGAAALVRRGDVITAARALLELSEAWLRRGRLASAGPTAREAADHARAAGDDGTLADTALVIARVHTEAGELIEAESTLRSSLAAARARADQSRILMCSVALGHTLFWQGRFDEAWRHVGELASTVQGVQTALDQVNVEVAIGRQDLVRAVSLATTALEEARRCLESRADADATSRVAQCAGAAAFAHLSVGDHRAVERDVELAIPAAREARRPLTALHARLLLAESRRREGRHGAAAAVLARVSRVLPATLPATTRGRIEVLRIAMADGLRDGGLDRLVTRTGLVALRLFAPDARAAARTAEVDETLELLRLGQVAEDEAEALGRVCATLRRALRASAVGVLAPHIQNGLTLASDGRSLDRAVAERVAAAGHLLRHDPDGAGAEVGTPVRYGGRALAVIVCRWSAGTVVDHAKVATLLAVAATVVGPVVATLVARLTVPPGADEIVGASAALTDIRRAVERAAAAPYPVLIEGESGSGKELVARAVHRHSPRRDRTFCPINCAALPDDLLEAELFGHARGAFTGAMMDRAGVFEEAHGGTLFLDEIGELSARGQAKLLRVMQGGELRRVGENTPRRVDVRIVAATNRDLREEVAAGRFRVDLLYRLDVVRIVIPPLRERLDDLPTLIEHFWRDAATRVGSRAVLGADTVQALTEYHWPGNVRELQNVLAALSVRCPRRGVIGPAALPSGLVAPKDHPALTLTDARRGFEERFIRAALVRTGGHRGRAAAELGLTRQGLQKLLARRGIAARSVQPPSPMTRGDLGTSP